MNRFTTLLLTCFLLFVSNIVLAQGPTFTITPQTQSVTAGSTVSFTVNVTNFTTIEGFQYSMSWDATKLTYVSVSDITLQGLTPGSFALNGGNKLGLSWVTPTGNGVTFPNGVFYKVNFTALTTGTVDFKFSSMPTPPEITGNGSVDITNTSTFVPAVGTGGTSGGTTCVVPSGLAAVPANTSANITWAAAAGASNYNVQYKTAAATTWTTANTATPSFTVPALVTCTDYQVQVQTVCSSGSSPYSSPVSFKTTGCPTGGGTGTGGGSCWDCGAINLSGFGLIFSDEYADAVGNDVTVKLHSAGFTKIEGMQFEIKWDPTKLQYKDINPTLAGLTKGNMDLSQVTAGRIGLTWTDPLGTGLTLPDCSVLAEITFKTLGALGTSSTVSISKTSTLPTFEITANGNLNVPAGNLVAGKVLMQKCTPVTPQPTNCTPPSYTKMFNIGQKTAASLEETCVDVIVNNFKNIEGFQLSLSWNPNKLVLTALKNGALDDLTAGQYSYDASAGTLNMAYSQQSGNSVTLPNGSVVFQLCFKVTGNNGTSSDIKFSTALPLEVYVNSMTLPASVATTQNGKFNIAEKPIALIKELKPSCSGAATGSMTVEVTPTTGTYGYLWAGPSAANATTPVISNLKTGAYKVTVTDLVTCLVSDVTTAILANKAIPKFTKIGQNGNCIETIVTGGTQFTYLWNNTVATTTKDLCNIAPGLYKVTATNEYGCVKDTSAAFIKAVPSITNTKCVKDGKITIDDGGAANLTYTWSPNVSTSNTASNLDRGTYKVTISAPGVQLVQDLTVTGPDPLTISTVTVTPPPNGSVDISVTGGTGLLSYKWDNGAITQDITGLLLGTYKVTVTDANQCAVQKSFDVFCPDPLILPLQNITTKSTSCGLNNGEISINPLGGSKDYVVTWSSGSGTKLTNLPSGNYNVTVADKNCGSSIKVSDIEVKTSTAPKVNLDQAVDAKDNCVGSIALLVKDGVAPYTFVWSSNANGQTVKDPTNLCEGIYSVTITDKQPCVITLSDITVTGTTVPTIDDTKSTLTKTKCPSSSDGKISVEVKGGKTPFTYNWTLNGNAFAAKTKDLINLTTGKYKVTITDALGKTAIKEYVLTSESNLAYGVSVTDPTPSTAKNGAAIVQVTDGIAPYKYLWSNAATTNQINNLPASTYAVTVTDANGCSLVKTFPVGNVGSVEIVARTNFNGTNIRCFGMCNAIAEVKNVVDAKAPLTYKWSTGDTSRIVKGLCVGTHKVIVIDANKEQFEGSINIIGPDKLTLDIITTDATNGTDGRAEVAVKGGTAPFSYRWQNDGLGSFITNQPKGRVFVAVTDANGCDAFKDGFVGPLGAEVPCLSAIPVITPDGNGYNDFLDIYCLEIYPKNTLEVFNRYGQMVYSKENYINRSWSPLDSKGLALPDGGYFYVIDVVQSNGTHTKYKGSFSVLTDN